MSSNILFFLIIGITGTAVVTGKYTSDVKTTEVTLMEPHNFRNVTMHPACNNCDYCFEVPEDYPRELIATLMEKEKHLLIDGIRNQGYERQRKSIDHSIIELCKANSTTQPIYQIRDDNNAVRFVVQSDKFQQIVRLVQCRNPGEIVDMNAPIDLEMLRSESFKAVCVESYYKFKFLVLSLDGKRLEFVKVGHRGIPVCCRCEIQDVGDRWLL